jgi:hypothetical protein
VALLSLYWLSSTEKPTHLPFTIFNLLSLYQSNPSLPPLIVKHSKFPTLSPPPALRFSTLGFKLATLHSFSLRLSTIHQRLCVT